MKLLAFLMQTGGHIAGWRHPRAADNALCDMQYFQELARTAERGLFDGIFFADSVGYHPVKGEDIFACLETPKLEPGLVLAAIAATTRRIGLIATGSTTYGEPYDVARRFATLDHLSAGRAGWNIVTSTMENEAHNYGRDAHLGHSDRYARAAEFVDVACKLWDSWDDGAVLADKASGRYTDPSRITGLDHKGAYFRVAGPLNVPRSPQGHPVLVQAGASDTGKRFAARYAEVIFTSHPAKESAARFRTEMHELLAAEGRAADTLKIMPAITPIIGRTREEAAELQAQLDASIPSPVAISKLEGLLGNFDLSAYAPDDQLPPIPEAPNSTRDRVVELAQRERLSIRDLAQRVAAGRTSRTVVGTAHDVADELADWYQGGAADGFVISAPFLPAGLADFVDSVVPELQARGLFRREYEGETLRDHLGLARPANSFAADPSLRSKPEIW
ncbi:LLM class flavin-dependent oxidoreductase [uncultured Sphingomonas sp.]|uniref:LLM class flavin-dependent oxidoreductase n=1 Tax=uncultured Sphingomonas sp. TaxID=158754 RepID=UPI00260F3FC1|nr:LLM class flavin-dependent oxidoreductase [uncultured Sphingomonas sp.]